MDMSGHDHDHEGHGMWRCDGEPHMTEGGSWIGHFFPGMVFFIWGLHWYQGILTVYFQSLKQKGGEYRARPFHQLHNVPKYTEPFCKAVFPWLAISMELYFAHSGGYRNLVCPGNSERAGHFAGNHIGNWQHAAMYPGFIMSGFVDLTGAHLELPKGTQQVFLSIGFFAEALLMGMHKKHTPLDIALHSCLFYAMLATAVFILLEEVFPRNFLISCGRAAATLLQATWFWAGSRIMFEGRAAWDEKNSGNADMAPAMFLPALFMAHIITILAAMFCVYLVFYWYHTIHQSPYAPQANSGEQAGLLDEESGDKLKVLPLSMVPKHRVDVD